MKKLILKATLLLATTLTVMSAHAIEWTWSWNPSDDQSTAAFGSLTTSAFDSTIVYPYVGEFSPPSGGYLITEMTGTWNGLAITLLPVGAYVGNDNLLFDAEPLGPLQLDSNGVSFSTSDDQVWNFYKTTLYTNTAEAAVFLENTSGSYGTFTATQVAAVPEPETYALMLAGLALVGAAAKRRRKSI